MWLSWGTSVGEIILDYLGGLNVITGIFKPGEPVSAGVGEREMIIEGASERCYLAGFEDGRRGSQP